jgi:hypothetical protein
MEYGVKWDMERNIVWGETVDDGSYDNLLTDMEVVKFRARGPLPELARAWPPCSELGTSIKHQLRISMIKFSLSKNLDPLSPIT